MFFPSAVFANHPPKSTRYGLSDKRMLIGPGVHLVEHKDYQLGLNHVLELTKPASSTSTYTIDTYYRLEVGSTPGILRAIIESMEIPEWYGYDVGELLVSSLEQKNDAHLIVLVLRPELRLLIDDPQLVGILARTHSLARARRVRLETLIFTDPIIQRSRI